MPRYKLLALDMDGTLLTSDKRISPTTLLSIERAAKAGVAIALCTGRAINELSEYREMLHGVVHYASLVNGAHIIDLDTEKDLEVHPLDTASALAVAQRGRSVNAMVHVLTTRETAATAQDIDRMDQVGMGVYQDMFRKICTHTADVRTYIESHEGQVCKVNLYHVDQQTRAETLAWAQSHGFQAALTEVTSVEFTRTGITKAHGIEGLCRHVGCTAEQCVAVGDSLNDADALRAAGLAIVMGNASAEVKALADAIVADNDHDGIAEAIERFL